MKWPALFLSLAQLWLSAWANSAFGDRVLVVLDALSEQDRFSQFWSSLQARGFQLSFRDASSGPALIQDDEPAFDHVLLFAPKSTDFSSDLSPQSLFSFLSEHSATSPRNILAALSSDASDSWLTFAREFSIDFDVPGSSVLDHHTFVPALDIDQSHSTLALRPTKDHDASLGSKSILSQTVMHGAPVLYRGLAHTVPAHFPLATSILSGSPTSYSYSQSTTDQLTVESDIDGTNGPALIGSEAKLVTSFQTLTGSRASWTGSIDMFSDEFLQAMVDGQTTGNEAFISDLSKWTFQEEGVLRTDAVRHFIEGERQQKEQYRVRENLVYEIELSQFSNDAWRPVELEELQLEVTMLDPFWRVPLTPSDACSLTLPTSSCYSTTVKLPDRHGVFSLYVDFKRSGWTPIEEKSIVAITHPRHDEGARFFPGAWPFYASSLAIVSAFLMFVMLWLGFKDADTRKKVE